MNCASEILLSFVLVCFGVLLLLVVVKKWLSLVDGTGKSGVELFCCC